METKEPEPTASSSDEPVGAEVTKQPQPAVAHEDLSAWRGSELIDSNGEKIGTLEDVYFDIETDEAQFGTVQEGFIDRRIVFVPLVGVTLGPESIRVAVTKQLVKDGPSLRQEGGELSQEDESLLYHYFQMNYTPSTNPSGRRLARR